MLLYFNKKQEIISLCKEGGIFTIYEQALEERNYLEEQIRQYEKQIELLPEGKLICGRNGTRYKWYQSDGKNKEYIPKSNRQLAEQLANKKYISWMLEDLLDEKRAVDLYLAHHNEEGSRAEKLLNESPEFQRLIEPYLRNIVRENEEWMNAPYEQNPTKPEQLIYKGVSGRFFRSKSEVIIDSILTLNNIPNRYECGLQLGEVTVYPDFTIRHPKTKKIYYWEHFGMMDNPSYSKSVCMKLQLYTSCGIIPTIQLITTYETKKHPLNAADVERIITQYFCHERAY